MFNKLFFTFLLIFGSFITVYPSKKENTNLFNYCYDLEKIVSRNSIEKSKKVSKKFKDFAKDITLFGANKTKGDIANNVINQYKSSKKIFIVSFVPNKFYCLAGYWIEKVNPGTFSSIIYEKGKKSINKYNNIKIEVKEFLDDINSEYRTIQKEIKDLF